jgi:chromosome segregation ATPase
MRLVSVTVRNYRIHRERTVTFDPSRTVIGGPNESGKSTIAEAVHRALFLRSRASGAVLDSMRSQFHPGNPFVELTFEFDGSTCTVAKEFTGTNSAPTTLSEAGKPTLRNEQAEERLREILGTEAIGGRGAEDRLRMQWAHLWVWQGVAGADPLEDASMEDPLQRLQGRLGSLEAGDVLESRTDKAVGDAVTETHASRTKENGTPKTTSPLGHATTLLAEARTQLAATQAAIETLEGTIAEVERADATIAASDASLALRRQEKADNDRRLDEAQALEIRRAEQQAAATAAAARLAALIDGDRQIRECETRLAAIDARRAPATERQTVAVNAEKEADERCAAAQTEARECQHEQADVAELAELHSRYEHVERRRAERIGLAGRCGRIAALRAEAAEMQARLDTLPAVSSVDLTDLTALERKRDAAQATLDAIASRVELLAADARVRLGDHELGIGDSETITADAELSVGGTRLRISPGGGTSLTEATRSRDDAATALEVRLRQAGLTDVDEARRIQPLRQTIESSLAAKCSAITDLGDRKADADLATLDAEIADMERAFATATRADFVQPEGLDAAIAARQAVDERLHGLVRSLAAANAAQQAAEQRRGESRGQRTMADDAVRQLDDEFRTEEARRKVLVEEHGADRRAAISAATAARDEAQQALTATHDGLTTLQPDLLRQAAARLQRALEKLIEGRQTAQTSRTVALERLRTEGTLDPREDLARARAAERLAAAGHAQAAREARAYALLAALFAEKKREVEARFVGPLAGRVTDYLRCLFGPAAAVTVEYADGKFRSLALSRSDFADVPFDFGQLSGGGREQVSAAFRLAMAEILAAEHDGCLPIVLDDAFVNSDASRVAAVQDMLELAASRGLQVIVLSCNHHDYDGLGTTPVVLARASLEPRAIPAADGPDRLSPSSE